MKYTIGFLLLTIFTSASCHEIELIRTYNKVLIENNQLVVKMDTAGQVNITYPDFLKNTQGHNFKASINKLSVIEELVNQIDTKSTNPMLQNKLKVIKRNHNRPLFYSSDVDQVTLSIFNNNSSWKISIDNYAELEQNYEFMGQWQPLLDLIKEIESWTRVNNQSSPMERKP